MSKKTNRQTTEGATNETTPERAAELTHRIIIQDEDEQAKALIELVAILAYEENFARRDDLATAVVSAAFSRTVAFADACHQFTDA
ncbi:MAG: hypothetical protein WCD76_21320 [Pyrinomonadaceae bacterium]